MSLLNKINTDVKTRDKSCSKILECYLYVFARQMRRKKMSLSSTLYVTTQVLCIILPVTLTLEEGYCFITLVISEHYNGGIASTTTGRA